MLSAGVTLTYTYSQTIGAKVYPMQGGLFIAYVAGFWDGSATLPNPYAISGTPCLLEKIWDGPKGGVAAASGEPARINYLTVDGVTGDVHLLYRALATVPDSGDPGLLLPGSVTGSTSITSVWKQGAFSETYTLATMGGQTTPATLTVQAGTFTDNWQMRRVLPGSYSSGSHGERSGAWVQKGDCNYSPSVGGFLSGTIEAFIGAYQIGGSPLSGGITCTDFELTLYTHP